MIEVFAKPRSRLRKLEQPGRPSSRFTLVLICLGASALLAVASCTPSPGVPASSPQPPTPVATRDLSAERAAVATAARKVPTESIDQYADLMTRCRLPEEYIRLIIASDPEAYARTTYPNLNYRHGRVQVELSFAPGADADRLIQKYDLQERPYSRSSRGMGVLAPLNSLCDLSNDPAVKNLYPPAPAVPADLGVPSQPTRIP